ncbi:MAG TPA: hypothetical protein VGQ95_05475 [Chthoniobacterales bacterium]|nr:hypothetical protein [Chthoniobacterales bacterium]
MTYWRMQLHPDAPGDAVLHSTQSLCAGFIGLDFEQDVGDLMRTTQARLPQQHRDYWEFAHGMAVNDRALIIAHHFPFALVTVAGNYNYIREPVPEIGVWFRHFRRIKDVQYYADRVTDASSWHQIKMTDAISPLRDPQSQSYQLIDNW